MLFLQSKQISLCADIFLPFFFFNWGGSNNNYQHSAYEAGLKICGAVS